jgi:hypothetical protein
MVNGKIRLFGEICGSLLTILGQFPRACPVWSSLAEGASKCVADIWRPKRISLLVLEQLPSPYPVYFFSAGTEETLVGRSEGKTD